MFAHFSGSRSAGRTLRAPGSVHLPQADELHWVGVVRGRSPRGHHKEGHPEGFAHVVVNRPGKTVNLVITAAEPVWWKVSLRGGTLKSVVVSGWADQVAQGSGIDQCPLVLLSTEQSPGAFNFFFACPEQPADIALAKQRLRELTTQPLTSFQGHITATTGAYFVGSDQ